MNITLLVGILGGLCTLIAAVLTPLIQRRLETKNFPHLSSDRAKALTGTWKGFVTQNIEVTDVKKYNVDLLLDIKGKKVYGEGKLYWGEAINYVILEGSFRNTKFLKMDYQNKNIHIIQFGSFVFELSDDCKILKGRFVGYGQINQKIVYGNAEFKKE